MTKYGSKGEEVVVTCSKIRRQSEPALLDEESTFDEISMVEKQRCITIKRDEVSNVQTQQC